jgi:hypothetical protein
MPPRINVKTSTPTVDLFVFPVAMDLNMGPAPFPWVDCHLVLVNLYFQLLLIEEIHSIVNGNPLAVFGPFVFRGHPWI